jgi:phage gpG-like protein
MARIPKVEYKINLETMFAARLDIDDATKEAIGQAIIDKIVERTQDNLDKNNKSLGSYSKSYRSSVEFEILKGAKRAVDLTATGDMLAALTITKTTPQTITIGFNDTEQNTKAYGHISGMEGHPVLEGRVQKRDFMGLPDEELNKISADFAFDVEQIDRIQNATTRQELDQAVLSYIDELSGQIIPSEDIG